MGNMTKHDTVQGVFHEIPSPRLLLSSPPPLAGEAGWGLSRRDGRLPGFARRFRRRKRPLTLPSPGGRGSSGARGSLLPVMGIGATPAFSGGDDGGQMPALRLARNQAREPRRRKTRPPAQGRARAKRAQNRVLPPGRNPAAERNEMEERYAEMERQSIGKGMANMTSHDKT